MSVQWQEMGKYASGFFLGVLLTILVNIDIKNEHFGSWYLEDHPLDSRLMIFEQTWDKPRDTVNIVAVNAVGSVDLDANGKPIALHGRRQPMAKAARAILAAFNEIE